MARAVLVLSTRWAIATACAEGRQGLGKRYSQVQHHSPGHVPICNRARKSKSGCAGAWEGLTPAPAPAQDSQGLATSHIPRESWGQGGARLWEAKLDPWEEPAQGDAGKEPATLGSSWRGRAWSLPLPGGSAAISPFGANTACGVPAYGKA